MIIKICALLGAAFLLTAQACFAEDQWGVDTDIPKAKTELAALSEEGRIAFRKALIACSLYADNYNNATYKDACEVASKVFTVEFSNERATLKYLFSLAISMTDSSEVGDKMAAVTGKLSPMIGNPGGKAYIAALQKAYRETNSHVAAGVVTASPVRPSGRPSPSTTGGQILVPLQRQGGTYVVPVLINKAITLNFIIDSGASDVSIPADVVSTLIRTGTLQDSDFLGTQTYNRQQTINRTSDLRHSSKGLFLRL
jgi:hypothetical protein